MRNLGWMALIGAGAGYLVFSGRGRRWASEARQRLQDSFGGRGRTEQMVRDRLEGEVPETEMTQAFREAVA